MCKVKSKDSPRNVRLLSGCHLTRYGVGEVYAIQENYEDRIMTTEEALKHLEDLIREALSEDEEKKSKGFDDLTFFFSKKLDEYGISNSDNTANSFTESFKKFPNWKQSEAETRELRQELYLKLLSDMDDIDKAKQIIEDLFNIILKANE